MSPHDLIPLSFIEAECRTLQRRAFLLGVVAAVGFGLMVTLLVLAL